MSGIADRVVSPVPTLSFLLEKLELSMIHFERYLFPAERLPTLTLLCEMKLFYKKKKTNPLPLHYQNPHKLSFIIEKHELPWIHLSSF